MDKFSKIFESKMNEAPDYTLYFHKKDGAHTLVKAGADFDDKGWEEIMSLGSGCNNFNWSKAAVDMVRK